MSFWQFKMIVQLKKIVKKKKNDCDVTRKKDPEVRWISIDIYSEIMIKTLKWSKKPWGVVNYDVFLYIFFCKNRFVT